MSAAFKRRKRLFESAKGLCYYCGKSTWLPDDVETKKHALWRLGLMELPPKERKIQFLRRRATIEHLIKVADGGGNEPENLVLACFRCNGTRHDVEPERFKIMMTRPDWLDTFGEKK